MFNFKFSWSACPFFFFFFFLFCFVLFCFVCFCFVLFCFCFVFVCFVCFLFVCLFVLFFNSPIHKFNFVVLSQTVQL